MSERLHDLHCTFSDVSAEVKFDALKRKFKFNQKLLIAALRDPACTVEQVAVLKLREESIFASMCELFPFRCLYEVELLP